MVRTPTFIVFHEGATDAKLVMGAFALRIASRHVANGSQARNFSEAQLMACLLIRAYMGGTMGELVSTLRDVPALQHVLGLPRVPHASTLQRFSDRTDPGLVRKRDRPGDCRCSAASPAGVLRR